ncbi:hypothetical protein I9W82_004923 [Candida metapsilosis]|uniref:Hap4 transcription factor heteromerisation domain-containing protein n=1 Tax=Candida metapsilosis TaxID=273372 RepID=A0A8H8D9W4_9ASCO|nr:hypothetical protein I9W82_004923 [Candida metapsilosis]
MDGKSTAPMESKITPNVPATKLPTEGVQQQHVSANSLHSQSNKALGSVGPAPTNSIKSNTSQSEQRELVPNQKQLQIQPSNSVKPKGKSSVIASKNQAVRQHPLRIAPKYAKIQPAIAPKPSNSVPVTTKFNPIPSSKFQLSMRPSLSQDAKNLNTSKKWILPPRPRPGRKRTGSESDKVTKAPATVVRRKSKPKTGPNTAIHSNDNPEKSMMRTNSAMATAPTTAIENGMDRSAAPTGLADSKDVAKSQEPFLSTQSRAKALPLEKGASLTLLTKNTSEVEGAVTTKSSNEMKLDAEIKQVSKPRSQSPPAPTPAAAAAAAAPPPPPPPIKQEDPEIQMTELKVSYLAKLKEQEIIRNYVEVLTNQIKELSFVQNGVITFDALKNTPKVNPNSQRITSTLTKSKCDQLDSINNLNDLNKFLNYLSKSSDIIKSAKRQPTDNAAPPDNLNQQIDNYVQLRNRFKMLSQENSKKGSKKKMNKHQADSTENARHTASSSSSAITPKNASPKSPFTPDLLRPLNASNLFNDPNLDMMEMDLQTETIEASPSTAEILADNDKLKTTSDSLTMEFESSKFGVDGNADGGEFFHVDEHDFLSKLVLDDGDGATTPSEEPDLGEVVIHKQNGEKSSDANGSSSHDDEKEAEPLKRDQVTNDMIMKKKMKFNCGFCTNDTPCLCFDSDLEISRLN